MIYNKLVRNNIPRIIRGGGNQSVLMRKCQPDEIIPYLIKKLHEETKEFTENVSVEELADIYEVIYALANELGGINLLNDTRKKKVEERGSFSEHIILIETTDLNKGEN